MLKISPTNNEQYRVGFGGARLQGIANSLLGKKRSFTPEWLKQEMEIGERALELIEKQKADQILREYWEGIYRKNWGWKTFLMPKKLYVKILFFDLQFNSTSYEIINAAAEHKQLLVKIHKLPPDSDKLTLKQLFDMIDEMQRAGHQ